MALESGFYPGQHVGVREDGEIQPPAETPPMDRASLFVPFPHFYSPSPAVSFTHKHTHAHTHTFLSCFALL